ncbi:MAG: hypothetical protein EA422_09065 [Gemmatimonadales bacterium]|nr:MAG: hypothetical protein EA422_09065 [Gemmatimonadales bacterium]
MVRGPLLVPGGGLPLPGLSREWRGGWSFPGPWAQGGNPAGLATADLPGGERFQAVWGHVDGAYRHPQSPRSSQGLHLGMEGSRSEGPERWTLYGAFHYGLRWDQDQLWSAVDDPQGPTPYVWADSTGGAWDRTRAMVHGAVGSPRLGGGWRLGGAVHGSWGQGARENDPRPLVRTRDLWFTPGVSREWGPPDAPRVTLAGHLRVGLLLEESDIGGFASRDPFVYRLRGYGTFDRTQLVRAEREQTGRHLGAGIQVGRSQGQMPWAVGVEVGLVSDSTRQGIATPEFAGGTEAQMLTVHMARGGRVGDGPSSQVAGELHLARLQGEDPVFRAVNVWTDRVSGGIRWSGEAPVVGPRLRQAGASVGLASHVAAGGEWDRREDRAAATELEVGAAWVGLGVALVGGGGGSAASPGAHFPGPWGAGAEVGRRQVLHDRMEVGRPTLMTQLLVTPGHGWNRASYVWGGLHGYATLADQVAGTGGGRLVVWSRLDAVQGRGEGMPVSAGSVPAGAAPAPSDPGGSRLRVTLGLELQRRP